MKTTVEKCFDMTSLFEAEVLVQLMLARWEHPSSDDPDFASDLLEGASQILRESMGGEEVLEGVPPEDVSLITAIWCAEHRAVDPGRDDPDSLAARKAWLKSVRRALPSCFCDSSDLI
jgi:hypothetical protein